MEIHNYNTTQIKKYLLYRVMRKEYNPVALLPTPIGDLDIDNIKHLIQKNYMYVEDGKFRLAEVVEDKKRTRPIDTYLKDGETLKKQGKLSPFASVNERINALRNAGSGYVSRKTAVDISTYVSDFEQKYPDKLIDNATAAVKFDQMMAYKAQKTKEIILELGSTTSFASSQNAKLVNEVL